MNRRFFIASVGEPGKGYDEENLGRCIKYDCHAMNQYTTQKGVFEDVTKHSICFLKFNNKLIAYGEVERISTENNNKLDEWNWIIKVDEWVFFDKDGKKDGVSNYGVSLHILKGSQMATVKEITSEYGLEKMAKIDNRSNLYAKVINEKKSQEDMDEIISLLKTNKNLILTGAPGTGKTYLAKKIAESTKSRYDFVQFHPSYDYTDFVEGLRPKKEAGEDEIGFELKNGVFKDFCKEAKNNPKHDYIFIIDEINRGEISKIFGELFFSIDPGYRGTAGTVKTQYANIQTEETRFDDELDSGNFYVPDNVYIIGTMNDIDRSVESFDFAMRRRFTWKEITAKESQQMFDGESWKELAIKRMDNLNDAVVKIEGLNTSFQIGAAYLKNNLPKYENNEKWQKLWDFHLHPLLFEYLRGVPTIEEDLNNLEIAYNAI